MSKANPSTYAEILALTGYLDESSLYARVHAWRALIDAARPDVLVADAAPTALLAARGTGVRCALYGVGFFSPPRISLFPSFRPWQRVSSERAARNESVVLGNVNRVLKKLGAKPLDALYELLQVEDDLLLTLPELDHYPVRPKTDYWGPVFDAGAGEAPQWPDAKGKRLFVYLRPGMPGFAPLARGLSASSHSVLWFAPGMRESDAARLSTKNLRFVRKPLAIKEVAQSAEAAITYSGHSTVAALLLGGVPQLLLPTHVEQFLLARNIARMGAGIVLAPTAAAAKYGEALTKLVQSPSVTARAKEFAGKYRSFNPRKRLSDMAARLGAVN